MLDLKILNANIQEFINKNIDVDISKLALQKNNFPEIDYFSILTQIASKSKAKNKLPKFFKTKNIIFPTKLSVEQSSSEKAAFYKSTIVIGEKLIDLTGGFGVDDYYFSKKVKNVVHCEIDKSLSEIVTHNFKVLKANNIECYKLDSSEVLKNRNENFNWIYIDPSRRNDSKGKVFMLKDCLPNVVENLDFYFKYTENILVKTAPILDIHAGLSELKNVKEIHIVAVDNEVKELLWVLKKDYQGKILIKTININKDENEIFSFELYQNQINSNYCLPKKYLYEPNAAIMKSGGFAEIGNDFKLEKLHQFSHLYTSDSIVKFPGRIFEIEKTFNYNKAGMKTNLENQKANITTRNFPESVENIRKKYKIKDGGNSYCFFTTNVNDEKIVLICKKI